MRNGAAAVAAFVVTLVAGCSSVKMESQLPAQSLESQPAPGTSRVFFYNDAGSKRVGIQVDGKGVAALSARQYVRIDLKPGRHHLDLSHIDTLEFHDEYPLMVGEGDLYLRTYSTSLSTNYEASPAEPPELRSFKPVKLSTR